MAVTRKSRQTVFRRIARQPYTDWPIYDSTSLYDRTSLAGLESDVRLVAVRWFKHHDHDSIEEFVCSLPLAYFVFDAHDRYAGFTQYKMETLFRVFVLKELHRWEYETALVDYLTHHPHLREQLDLETIPDQSTLWRNWNNRFTDKLREAVQKRPERSSSKRRTRMSRSRANQTDTFRLGATTRTSRIQTTEPSLTKLRR